MPSSYFQSPLYDELLVLDVKDDTTDTPEPGSETEIEIAASAKSVSDSGSETNRGKEIPSSASGSALTQKLAGILGPRPGSSLSSRKDSGCSTPVRSSGSRRPRDVPGGGPQLLNGL